MAEFRITNCHIHLFTSRHVPVDYPHRALRIFRNKPKLVRIIAVLAGLIGQKTLSEKLDRLYRFARETRKHCQKEIFADVEKFYPKGTRFVVLPMDLRDIGFGEVTADIRAQHGELAELADSAAAKGRILPFASIYAGRDDALEQTKYAIDKLGFKGLKLYPKLGYSPTHPTLMNEIYPYVSGKNLPVMTHCSRGGIKGAHISVAEADAFTDPAAYIPVLRKFKDMRLCLAHFGGQDDWQDYAKNGSDPYGTPAQSGNWQILIRDMIGSGQYPNLWTDISYTLFHFSDFIPFLKIFLMADTDQAARLRTRVLFGSDFYMTRQEVLSEREVCFRLRTALGDEMFRQIAETNPEIWLGERPEPAKTAALFKQAKRNSPVVSGGPRKKRSV